MPKNFSCNLGSLNLYEFVKNPYTDKAYFDFEDFTKSVGIAVEALDTIIDENANRHALKEQSENSLNYRNVGLGAFGYANMLFALKLKYGSKEAIKFTDALFKCMLQSALETSCNLAKEKGAFPKCKKDRIVESKIIKQLNNTKLVELIKEYGLRNCSLLSIAPNGSTATMMSATGGCEPEFALSYTRRTDNLKESYEVYSKSVKEYWEMTDETVDVGNIDSLPDYFITSKELKWKDRVDTQAVMQKYVDTAISSTVNLPKETTMEEIEQLYLYAWEKGLKGITIFRDGCKKFGILTTEDTPENDADDTTLKRGDIIKVTNNVIGKKRKLQTGCGSLHCTAFFDPVTGDLLETYLSKGSTGGCNNFMVGLSRMISLSARGGIAIDNIIDQLNSTGSCPSYAVRSSKYKDTSKGACCPMAVGNALKEMYEEIQLELKNEEKIVEKKQIVNPCPECGEELIEEGNCNICKSCGFSKCD